jgi:hypothetical protein
MSLAESDPCTGLHRLASRHWQQDSANGSRQADHREELTMTNFTSNATAALIILGLAITWLSVFGSVIAGTLGA